MNIVYFDCIAGISGDMALAALVDAGADFEELRGRLVSLPIQPFTVELEQIETYGLRAKRVQVHSEATAVIRTYASIRALIDEASLPPEAADLAHRIFRRLAEAEAIVHGKELDLVTFHEVGAVDSIVDIVGTALALTTLGVDRVFASPVPTGFGMTKTEHGATPIPAPATVELLRGVPIYSRGVPVELTTPTGAAILAATVEGFGEMPTMRVETVGYGAGTHRLEFPNVLRVMVGEEVPAGRGPVSERGTTGELVLETNVDDLNPELYGYVLERLLAAGAQDAWLSPIVMKKGRPAVTVSVLCSADRERAIKQVLFSETGTLGVRSAQIEKEALERETAKVETRHGTVAVKVGYLEGRAITISPEYEDCARIAREAGIAAREIYEEALALARRELR